MTKKLSAKEVEEKLAAKEPLNIVDVREDEEVAEGMIPGAMHVALQTIPEQLNKFDKDKEYILVCRSGGRSGRAQEFLESKGFDTVNMTGGMLDWEGPVE